MAGCPVILTTGSIKRMNTIFRRLVNTRIFFLPNFLIKNGATIFGQNEALPAMAVTIEYCAGEHAC